MKNKRVEKIKKTKHVGPTALPNQRHLSGMRNRPLVKRKNSNGDSDAVLLRGKHSLGYGDEMNDLPATHYELGYMT